MRISIEYISYVEAKEATPTLWSSALLERRTTTIAINQISFVVGASKWSWLWTDKHIYIFNFTFYFKKYLIFFHELVCQRKTTLVIEYKIEFFREQFNFWKIKIHILGTMAYNSKILFLSVVISGRLLFIYL